MSEIVDSNPIMQHLQADLEQVVAKYRAGLPGSFMGAAVCLADHGAGALALSMQETGEVVDTNLAMALALLEVALQGERRADVRHVLRRTGKLIKHAAEIKTGALHASGSLH